MVSNKAPCVPNRGYSRLQHLWFMERVIDICAHEIGIPADEMRLRNYIQPEQFPYTTPNGNIYDSGNYPQMLANAKEMSDYQGWREKQAAARAQGWAASAPPVGALRNGACASCNPRASSHSSGRRPGCSRPTPTP